MPVSFHPATAPDLPVVLELMREYYALDHLPFHEAKASGALERLVGDDTLGCVWVIRSGEEVAGYVVLTLGYSLEFGGRDAFVDELFVRAAYRGQGIGRAALALVEEACRRLQVGALHLEVERCNLKAQAFYRRTGFQDHDRYLLTKHVGA